MEGQNGKVTHQIPTLIHLITVAQRMIILVMILICTKEERFPFSSAHAQAHA